MTATIENEAYTGSQLSGYDGKRVVVTHNLPEKNDKGEGAVEIEGTVQVGNEIGLLIKPKGQVNFKLVPLGEIEPGSIKLVQDKSTTIKASKLKPVKIGQARRHLLERHGFTLTKVNGLTEEDAAKLHDSIDHVESDLGHVHMTEAEAAAAAEKGDSDDES